MSCLFIITSLKKSDKYISTSSSTLAMRQNIYITQWSPLTINTATHIYTCKFICIQDEINDTYKLGLNCITRSWAHLECTLGFDHYGIC